MKIQYQRLALCLLSLFILASCQKDQIMPDSPLAHDGTTELTVNGKFYQKHGRIAQKALVAGIGEAKFRALLQERSLLREDGDTEILLKDLLKTPWAPDEMVQDFLLHQYNQQNPGHPIDLKTLTAFSDRLPSIIVGVRGPVEDWATESHVPVLMFLPLKFEESTTSFPGMTATGEMVDVDLSQRFEQVVLTLAPSERHTATGELKVNAELARRGVNSAVNLNEVAAPHANNGHGNTLRMMEPATCANANPDPVTNLTATNTPGGILLTWDAGSNAQYGNLGTWARWAIYRNGVEYYSVYASAPPSYTDQNLSPLTNYTYSVRFTLMSLAGNCSSPFSHATATSGPAPAAPTAFMENVNQATKINFFWNNPNQNIQYSRIERFNYQSGYWNSVAHSLEPNVTSYQHTATDRGIEHLYRIRSKGPTGWSNPTYRAMMNPYRDSGQPLAVYGFRIWNVASMENPALGDPELHLSASNGTLNEENPALGGVLLHNNTYVPLSRCINSSTRYLIGRAGNVYLFNQWLYSLYGSVCRVVLVETDQTDPFIDDLTVSNETSSSTTLSSTTPTTSGENVNMGSTTFTSNITMTSSTSFTINTVHGDIVLGTSDIFYWDQTTKFYDYPLIRMYVSTNPSRSFSFCGN